MSSYPRTFNPCDECNYSYSKNNEVSSMCKICEFKQYLELEEQGRLIVQEYGQWIDDGHFILCPICGNSWSLFDNCTEDFDYCPKCGSMLAELKGAKE